MDSHKSIKAKVHTSGVVNSPAWPESSELEFGGIGHLLTSSKLFQLREITVEYIRITAIIVAISVSVKSKVLACDTLPSDRLLTARRYKMASCPEDHKAHHPSTPYQAGYCR